MASQSTHILYHNVYSLNSIMARHCYAARGPAKDAESEMRVQEQAMDIFIKLDQLDEDYLCNLNPLGEVPTLATVDRRSIIPDSVNISFCLAESYPRLVPSEHAGLIRRMLDRLHEISIFTLTMSGKPAVKRLMAQPTRIEQAAETADTSDYGEKLLAKADRYRRLRLSQLSDSGLERAMCEMRELLNEVDSLLSKSSTGWILDTTHPTALDLHIIPTVVRLQETGREELVPKGLTGLAGRAIKQPEWAEVMQGRQTIAPPPPEERR